MLALIAFLLTASPTASVEGKVTVSHDGAAGDCDDVVVYLTFKKNRAKANAAARAKAATRVHAIEQRRSPSGRSEFWPHVEVVLAGETVCFPNNQEVVHNVFSKNPDVDATLPYHASACAVFTTPGASRIGCNKHEWMSAWVLAVENPLYARPSACAYRINAPPGEYDVHCWHPNGTAEAVQAATLVEGESATVSCAINRVDEQPSRSKYGTPRPDPYRGN
jgi:plastocyanin